MKNIDEYEDFLNAKVAGWSPTQRTAFAAGMVERWLHAYDTFSAAEQWGDAAHLRRVLDAIWRQVGGQPIAAPIRSQYASQVEECMPHMDDFDHAEAALAVCAMLGEALDVCAAPDEPGRAVRPAFSGFEAALPDWALGLDEHPRLWKGVATRNELKKQRRLGDEIDSLTRFDDASIAALRKTLTSRTLLGKTEAPTAPVAAPAGITNQTAFEQYRSMVSADLRQPVWDPPSGTPFAAAMKYVRPWMARYSRRLQTINGSYGQLADSLAQEALVARSRAHDRVSYSGELWDGEMREMVTMMLGNNLGVFDVTALDEPHGYGPSLRRLWVSVKLMGRPDREAFDHIIQWARHQPPAWAAEDRRKKKGLAYVNPALGQHAARSVSWTRGSDPDFPWESEVDGNRWRVRLNDFPDDIMYTLLIGDEEVGPFHDWPSSWHRS